MRRVQRTLHALETEGVWLREALAAEDESIPARVIAAPEKGSAHWGWIAAFGLGTRGAYTIWSGFIDPSLTQASQAGFTQGNVLTTLFFTGAFWKGWDTMRSLNGIHGDGHTGTVAIWLLRKQWQRFTAIAFVMGALAFALALPRPVAAAVQMHVDESTPATPATHLPAGQEVKTDLRRGG